MFCDCQSSNEEVILLDIARQSAHGFGISDLYAVHKQFAFHQQTTDVALVQNVE